MFSPHAIELKWIQHLQDLLRSPVLDPFFQCCHYIDTFPFSFIVISLLWHLINKDMGIKVLYVAICSMAINLLLKSFFQLPRPCHLDPSVGLFCPLSYGFPSGAAQTAYLIVGITWMETQKRLYRYSSLGFAIILCFSRVYLGVHFFSDIIGGLFLGSLIIWCYARYSERIREMGTGVYFLPPLILFYFHFFFYLGLTLGVALGLSLDQKASSISIESLKKRFLNFLIAILGTSLLLCIPSISFEIDLLIALLSGFWFSYLAFYTINKVEDRFFYRPKVYLYKSNDQYYRH